jgi:DNA processing protein
MDILDFEINEFKSLKKPPKEIYYIGNKELLKKTKVSIIGSRRPNSYAKEYSAKLAFSLAKRDIVVVSGGAMGVDAIAHKNAFENTIMVSATGLDVRYPSINKNLIKYMEENALVISRFKPKTPSMKYHFPLRNELIVALGEILIVTYADFNSGSLRSIEYALKMKKDIYVLPHRLNESKATNELLKQNKAKAIYDVDEFLDSLFFEQKKEKIDDEFLVYCSSNPKYDEAVLKDAQKVFEYELSGKIEVKNGYIYVI